MLWYYPAESELSQGVVPIGSVRLKRRPSNAVRDARRPKSKPAPPAPDTPARSLFEEAFQNSPALNAIVRIPDNVIVEVNEAFARTLGFRREEALGKTPVDLQFWVNPERLPAFRDKLSTDGFVRNYEVQVRTKGGEIRSMLLSAQVVLINGVPHSMSAAVDVTEQKRAEAELQKALVEARELTQLKSDFVSLVSHEFRTPLEVIMSSTDNLERYHDRLTPEKRQQLLRMINKSVSRMSYMMEDVLLMGRIESGRIDFKPVVFDLPSFCRRLCDEMETARNRRCAIKLTVKGKLAAARGDEIVLRHILTNLLSNAMKFSPAGEVVELNVSREGPHAIFKVVDRGCGIPAADQARLFQAFHRGSNVRQLPGTGLGLVIVQRSILLHSGEIQFQSIEGKGTTFTVRVPLFTKTT
jgi:PAS domain S-box-containing protein